MTCDVDRNGVVTLRFANGAEFRYIPWAQKASRAQTCSSTSNGLGEWRRTDIIDPDGKQDWRRLIIPSEDPSATNNE